MPWGHQTRLLDRIKDCSERLWYLNAAVEHGWSQNVLIHQIASGLHKRQGKELTNFSRTLPPEDSDLAAQILKDPYQFDFLTLGAGAKERELERGLLAQLRDLLLELGAALPSLAARSRSKSMGRRSMLIWSSIMSACIVIL